MNLAGPVAMTVGEVIFAVNVTAWPEPDGFSEDVPTDSTQAVREATWLCARRSRRVVYALQLGDCKI
jgi:hypothetical protein